MKPHDYLIPLVTRPFHGTFAISSPFGSKDAVREHKPHKGIDFAMPEGTPLFACFDGEALFRDGMDKNKAGTRVHIFNAARGLQASYFHMSNFVAEAKTKAVKMGELIGWSGNTGHSTGPHLHFEIKRISDAMPLHPYFDDEYTIAEVRTKTPYELEA